MLNLKIKNYIVVYYFLLCGMLWAQGATQKNLPFAEFRSHVIEKMGSAQKRIWLVTDFLSDGDIASALYIAKYRQVDVQVLLDKRKVNQYMSRLRYLESQKIAVFLIPDSYPKSLPVTAMLIDDVFLTANRSLDFLLKTAEVAMQEDASKAQDFANVFTKSASMKIGVKAAPLPDVGRPGVFDNAWKSSANGKTYQPSSAYGPKAATGDIYRAKKAEDDQETYYYKKQKEAKPEGLPGELPKKTKQQIKNNLSP